MQFLSPASIKDIFLSEIIPAIEHLSEENFFAEGYPSRWEIPFVKEKVANTLPVQFHNGTIGESHSHSFYELCFGITGRCVININTKHFIVDAGDTCLFAPGVKHYEICTKEKSPYRLMWSSVIPGHARFWMCEFSREHFTPMGGIDVEVDVKFLVDEIVREIKNKSYKYFSVIKTNLLKLCINVARNMEKQPSRHGIKFVDWKEKIIREATEHIRKNIAHKLNLGEVAQVLRLSPNYFCTLFSEGTGFSFKDYINKVKIEKAKELLRDSRFSIKEIAQLTGFEDPAYFTRVFTQLAGKPPSEYRTR